MGYLDAPYLGLHDDPYPEVRPAPNKGWVRGLLDSVTPDTDTWRGIVGLLSNQSLRQRPPDVPVSTALKTVADATPIGPLIDTAVQSDELRQAREGGDSYGTGKSIGDLAKTVTMAFLPGSKGGKGAPIRAYHGSPHSFDRFDISKIGTGEGAQAYGHGLYFAENEGVARTYKAAGQPNYLDVTRADAAKALLADAGGDRLAAINLANERLKGTTKYSEGKLWQDVVNNFDQLIGRTPGKMYEVDIHADPARFLDYDKPLIQQSPSVIDAVNRVGRMPGSRLDRVPDDMRGPLYNPLVNDPNATNALRDAGIPGLRYLDGGSRTAGQGSHNYVMFDDKNIEILRKYGIPIAAGGAAVTAVPGLLSGDQTY